MEANNSYWEQVAQRYAVAGDEDIIKRIKECQFVIDKLEKDELWKIVMKDVHDWITNLDSRWHEISDEKQLNDTRVLKQACVHLRNLKEGYVTDWKFAQDELDRRNDPDQIERDMEN